jgi:hypothetical protein
VSTDVISGGRFNDPDFILGNYGGAAESYNVTIVALARVSGALDGAATVSDRNVVFTRTSGAEDEGVVRITYSVRDGGNHVHNASFEIEAQALSDEVLDTGSTPVIIGIGVGAGVGGLCLIVLIVIIIVVVVRRRGGGGGGGLGARVGAPPPVYEHVPVQSPDPVQEAAPHAWRYNPNALAFDNLN